MCLGQLCRCCPFPCPFQTRLRSPIRKKRRKWGQEEGKGRESKVNLNIWSRSVDFTEDLVEMGRRELHHTSHSQTAQIPSWDLAALSLCSFSTETQKRLCLFYSPPHPTPLDYSVSNLVTLGTTIPSLLLCIWFWVRVAEN